MIDEEISVLFAQDNFSNIIISSVEEGFLLLTAAKCQELPVACCPMQMPDFQDRS